VVARVLHAINVARISFVNDGGVIQKLQVTERVGPDGTPTTTDNVLRVVEYGLSSNPPIGSDVVVVRPYGDRTQTLALGTNHQASRPTGLSVGDSQLYSQRGQKVWLAGDALHVDGGGLPVLVENFSTCTVKGDLHVTGDVIANFGGAQVSLVKHVHGISGGPQTTVPIPE
jgi:phage gp45-like